ncbi:MAG: hypothetical protein HY444_00370, partial [Nitrospirae bacterium]|nr:hypothetical protein [Nitrospirota bacterium]
MDETEKIESGEPMQETPSVSDEPAASVLAGEGEESVRLQALEERELKAILES